MIFVQLKWGRILFWIGLIGVVAVLVAANIMG
jgi:hypothetical protein